MSSNFEYHIQQGQYQLTQNNIFQAIQHFTQALTFNKKQPDIFKLLASCYMYIKQFTNAIPYWNELMTLAPDPHVYIQCGLCFKKLNNLSQAENTYQKGLNLFSNSAELHNELALLYFEQGQFKRAIKQIKQALLLTPTQALFQNNLGVFYQSQGNYIEAKMQFKKALEIDPEYILAHLNMAKVEINKESISHHLKAALSIDNHHLESLQQYGSFLLNHNNISQAIDYHKQALKLAPDDVTSLNGLAIAYQKQGRLTLARSLLNKARSQAHYHSNLLLLLRAMPDVSKKKLFQAFSEWESTHQLPQLTISIDNFSPERSLNIGYISPDFGQHSVSKIFKELFKHHSADMKIFAYSDKAFPDEMTEEIKGLSHHWKNSYHLSNEELMQNILLDKIDILIDLTGHTAHNRLQLFTARPAPIQITGLGLCETTGIKAIDYLLTDRFVNPPKTSQFAREKLAYISSFIIWSTPDFDMPLHSPPHLKNGYITFGNGNALFKMNTHVIECWAEILKQIPSAKLHLKANALSDGQTCQLVYDSFEKQGISNSRILISKGSSHQKHLDFYNQIDIALDPFPYNGGMSSCESLWMGVPLVVLQGGTNTGNSILNLTNQTQWLSHSIEEYIQIAIMLTQNPLPLKSSIRQSLLKSVLCNSKQFASSIERVYRIAWRKKCYEYRSKI